MRKYNRSHQHQQSKSQSITADRDKYILHDAVLKKNFIKVKSILAVCDMKLLFNKINNKSSIDFIMDNGTDEMIRCVMQRVRKDMPHRAGR